LIRALDPKKIVGQSARRGLTPACGLASSLSASHPSKRRIHDSGGVDAAGCRVRQNPVRPGRSRFAADGNLDMAVDTLDGIYLLEGNWRISAP